MAYKVVNEKGNICFDKEKFPTKKAAEQAIVDSIRGAEKNARAMKYYQKYKVRKA